MIRIKEDAKGAVLQAATSKVSISNLRLHPKNGGATSTLPAHEQAANMRSTANVGPRQAAQLDPSPRYAPRGFLAAVGLHPQKSPDRRLRPEQVDGRPPLSGYMQSSLLSTEATFPSGRSLQVRISKSSDRSTRTLSRVKRTTKSHRLKVPDCCNASWNRKALPTTTLSWHPA